MKAWRIGIVSAVLITALVGTTTALAAGPGHHHGWAAGTGTTAAAVPAGTCGWTGSCWRDTDGDGIRDTWYGACADADGDGIRDTCGRTVHGYVDANGDGICDHYGTGYAGGGHHGGRRGGHWGGCW